MREHDVGDVETGEGVRRGVGAGEPRAQPVPARGELVGGRLGEAGRLTPAPLLAEGVYLTLDRLDLAAPLS